MNNYDFIDTKKIYILGISNGGGFAPLVPESETEQAQVRGYISVGGWVKTWFEHMLEIERRRFALMGKSPGEVNDRMKDASDALSRVADQRPIGRRHFEGATAAGRCMARGKDRAHLYGRPLRFYQSYRTESRRGLVALESSHLFLRGAVRLDHESRRFRTDRSYCERKRWRSRAFYEIPETGHAFQHYLSLADAFRKEAPFDPKIIRSMTDWLEQQRKITRR